MKHIKKVNDMKYWELDGFTKEEYDVIVEARRNGLFIYEAALQAKFHSELNDNNGQTVMELIKQRKRKRIKLRPNFFKSPLNNYKR